MKMLITQPEEVFLVIIIVTAIRAHPYKAVIVIAGINYDQASANYTIVI